MRKHLIIMIIVLTAICITSLADIAGAKFVAGDDRIQFTSIPEKLEITSGEDIDFDVALTNKGTVYGDVKLDYRYLPEGITVDEGTKYKLIDAKKSTTYHVVLVSDENLRAGTYSFEIADYSDVDPSTWTAITLLVRSTVAEPRVTEGEGADEKQTPAFTFIQLLAVLLILCIAIRMGKHETK